ncbi:MAG TPA: transglycosylase family protein [Solirubrobacteraceae bacterium]|nr:transglycosylase family protein [Solirubrobacteraceae bacterium]
MVRLRAIPVVLLALLATALTIAAVPAPGRDRADTLRSRIHSQQGRESALQGAVAHLGRLERATAREVAILERRVADVQADLTRAQARLDDTVRRRDHERARALRLRRHLAASRTRLSALLRERYANGKPDVVTVVLQSDGFARLLETVDFIKRVQRQDARILGDVRQARGESIAQKRVLARLTVQRRDAADAVQRRHDALASIAGGLQARRAALAQARAARSAALHATRASRGQAERALSRLLAERARALRSAGPGGPWSIPWPIVQCESGGQNLPPNSAGASGYYQFLVSTWKGLGGSTPQAYLASKAEQDRLAAQLWNGGSGAGNWVCAGLVGNI